MDLETQSMAKAKLLLMVLQDQVPAMQAHPGQLQQAIYPQCACSSHSPHWLSTTGCTVFAEYHLSYYFPFGYLKSGLWACCLSPPPFGFLWREGLPEVCAFLALIQFLPASLFYCDTSSPY